MKARETWKNLCGVFTEIQSKTLIVGQRPPAVKDCGLRNSVFKGKTLRTDVMEKWETRKRFQCRDAKIGVSEIQNKKRLNQELQAIEKADLFIQKIWPLIIVGALRPLSNIEAISILRMNWTCFHSCSGLITMDVLGKEASTLILRADPLCPMNWLKKDQRAGRIIAGWCVSSADWVSWQISDSMYVLLYHAEHITLLCSPLAWQNSESTTFISHLILNSCLPVLSPVRN